MVKIRRRPSGRGSIPPTSRTSDDWKPEELRPDPVEVLREHTIGQARDVGARCPDDEKDTRNHKKTTDKEADRKAAEKDEKDGKETEARKGTSAEETLIEAIDKRRERSKKYLEGEAKKRNKKDDEKEAKKAEEQKDVKMRKQASKADADRTEEVNTPDKKWEAYMSLASLADVKRVLRIMATTAARLQGNAGG